MEELKGSRVARVGALELAWQGFGDPDDPAVLLIMGLGMQMLGWPEPLCEALAAQGLYVVRFDNRDMGASTWLDALGEPALMSLVQRRLMGLPMQVPYTLEDMAADAFGLLDALGIARAHLVGASLGGMIAQIMALQAPARALSLTSMMSTTGDPALPGPRPQVMGLMMLPAPRDLAGFEANAVQSWTLLSGGLAPPLEYVRERARLVYARGVHPAGFARQFAAVMASAPRTQALRGLRVPTLVVHGADDPLVPVACGEHTAACVPGARLEVIPRMGHTLHPSLWGELAGLLGEHMRGAAP
jgi:pimeloyl-ACP methyl ester carboxylesterase